MKIRPPSPCRAPAIAGAFAIAALINSCSDDPAETTVADAPPAAYVGRATCKQCHQTEHALWHGSHHDLAMQPATAATVLGNFDDAEFTHHGVTTTFFKRGETFLVRTDGPDGELEEYEVAYTFGVEPLQQYLVAFPDGRYQALSTLWDNRAKNQGGQRWYHLYGDEAIRHNDELHWTGPNQNWNFMCAACHSTGLQKNYDLAHDRFATTFFEMDVSCEACHGAGSRHVTWAGTDEASRDADNGLPVDISNRATWQFAADAVTAHRVPARKTNAQVETCAPCHVRGGSIDDAAPHGRPLLDSHYVTLLDESLYHADGQILDEVYVYGSFVQSKMYHAGVTCSDCHDPHSLQLRGEGNALCVRCHQPGTFDSPTHHMHEPGTAGANCVACHMPQRTYMGIDERADHSIRIPRPDLTSKIGTPNACNGCHQDQTARWASDAIREHRGGDYEPRTHYGEAIHAGRTQAPRAAGLLESLLANAEQPAIARATAASLLQRYPSRDVLDALAKALRDDEAVVRRATITALGNYPADLQTELLLPLLDDDVLGVRTEAARALAATPPKRIPAPHRARLATVTEEYIASQLVAADRPWAHVNIGLLRAQQGKRAEAVRCYQRALAIDPTWTPAYANLADLHREDGRDDLGEQVLRDGLSKATQKPELHHALGLLLARERRYDDAIQELRTAAEQRPGNAQFAFAHAIALHSTGAVKQAIATLERAAERHPRNRDILSALVSYHHGADNRPTAIQWAQRLVALDPSNPDASAILRELQRPR